MGWCQDAAIPHGGVGDRGYPRGMGSQVSVFWPKWPLDGWLRVAAIPHDGVGDRGYPRGMGSQLSHQGERRPIEPPRSCFRLQLYQRAGPTGLVGAQWARCRLFTLGIGVKGQSNQGCHLLQPQQRAGTGPHAPSGVVLATQCAQPWVEMLLRE